MIERRLTMLGHGGCARMGKDGWLTHRNRGHGNVLRRHPFSSFRRANQALVLVFE